MPSEKAIRMRKAIETAMQSVDDRTASEVPTLFPLLKGDGSLTPHGTRIQFDGAVYRAGSDLWDRAENAPDTAPDLWEKLMYRDGIRIIPETITVTSAFAKGEKGWWKDVLMESMTDSNVYTPEQYPDSWQAVKPDAVAR